MYEEREATTSAGDGGDGSWNELGGVVHGPAVQARDVHGGLHITVGRPTETSVPPRQLPPAPANFTGRSSVLADLNLLALGSDATRRLAVIVLTGAGGLGKTSVASHWLHSISDHYEGGALFADLRGHLLADAALPGDIAAGFLRALGAAPDRLPPDVAEQAAMYRSMTTGRRMIIFLDNVASAAQVRPLLPGPGPGPDAGPATAEPGQPRPSLVVVTTRWRIAGLALDGARFVELPPLEEAEALGLFDRMIGPQRAAAESAERRAVVRLCGGIPLAVCVIGARLAARPGWPVSRIAGSLASERSRLAALSLADGLSVRAAFDVSYRSLSPGAARAYRLTALIPGPGFDADLAVAVLTDDVADLSEAARAALDELADASLLTEDVATGAARYHYHDLTRLHAQETGALAPPAERHAALLRAVTWYLDRAVAADLAVNPGRWHLNPMYEAAALSPRAHASAAAALDWLESNLAALVATVHAAHDHSMHEQAWMLCEALWSVFVHRKHFGQWIASHLVGLASARAGGDPLPQSRMRVQLGLAFRATRRTGEAREQFLTALALAREAGHPLSEATALEQIGLADLAEARAGDAIGRFAAARDIHRRLGRQRGVALADRHIGEALRDLGRYDQALLELAEARLQFAALPDQYQEARTLTIAAHTSLLAGRPADAVQPLGQALSIVTGLGSRYEQARVTRFLGDAAAQAGDLTAARDYLRRALDGFEDLGAPEADEVRQELAAVTADADPG